MKKTIKLTFAALALTALASCSGDDLLGNGNNPLQQNKKNLTVEVEDLVDQVTTRAAINPDGATVWQNGDVIRVYDNALTKYDKYTWSGDTYESNEVRNVVTAPEYALFDPTASAKIKEFGWDYDTKESYVVYTINQSWEWAEDEESAGNGTIAYLSNLPMWGKVDEKEDGTLKADLKFLTSVIKINLTNIKNNVQGITVTAYEDAGGTKPAQMWGDFKAVLEDIDGPIEGAALVSAEDAKEKNSITVSLYDEEAGEYKTKRAQSILYIPIIARTYGKLEVSYTDKGGASHTVKTIDSGATFTVGRSREIKIDDFTFKNAGDIPTINEALAASVDQTGDVVIETENATEVKAGENEIIIPKGMATKNITLDLQGLTAEANQQFKITAEEGEYSGTLYVKVPVTYNEDGEMTDDTEVSNYIKNVYINMPNADVVLQGTWTYKDASNKASGVTFGIAPSSNGDDTSAAANTLVVKTLTVGEGTSVLNVYPNAECSLNNTNGADIMVAEGAKVGTLRLKNSTKIDDIVVNGSVVTLTANAKTAEGAPIVTEVTWGANSEIGTLNTNQQEIEITKNNGKIGTLTMSNGGNVTVNNAAITNLNMPVVEDKEAGLLTVKGAEGKVSTANVQGANVTVSTTKTANVAITTLKMGTAMKLTLTGGYITTLAEGTDLVIANNESYPTSITNMSDGVTLNEDGYTSRWCGKTEGVSTSLKATKVGTAADYKFMTATQFVMWTGAAPATGKTVALGANINLYNKEFTPKAAVACEFDGDNKTISNVIITKTATAKEEGVGLFKSVAADVKNLLIQNITINATSDGTSKYPYVGALAGKATAGTITDVNVTGAALTSDNFIVGGLIGEINSIATVTIAGREEASEAFGEDKFSTVAGSVTGLNKLGGLVGQITSGTVEIKNYKSSVELTATEEPTKDNVRDFGTVAPFVGTAVTGQLTAKEGLTVATPLTFAARLGHHFDANIDFKDGVYYYFVGRDELGYVSGDSFKLVRKNGNSEQEITTATTTVDTATNIANTNALNVYLKYDKYTD